MDMGHYGASKKLFAALVLLIIKWEEWEGSYKISSKSILIRRDKMIFLDILFILSNNALKKDSE